MNSVKTFWLTLKKFFSINTIFSVIFIRISAVVAQQSSSNNTVSLYSLPNFNGTEKTLNVLDCIPKLDKVFPGHLSSIQYVGASCVNLYKEIYCSGEHIEIRAHTPAHERLDRYHHESWIYQNSGAKSIGPCYEKCHAINIQHPGLNDSTHRVKLFDKTHFTGATVIVDVQNCTRIPQPFKVLGVQVNNESCVELYENEDCSGRSVRVREKTPLRLAYDLWSWGFGNTAVSVSLCGYNCVSDIEKESTWSVTIYVVMIAIISIVVLIVGVVVIKRRMQKCSVGSNIERVEFYNEDEN